MKFNTKTVVSRKSILYTFIRLFILAPLIYCAGYMLTAKIICNVMNSTLAVLLLFAMIVTFITLIPRLSSLKKSITYVSDDGYINCIYKNKEYGFDIIQENAKNNLVITHYTYSSTVGIKVKNLHKYKVVITGNSDMLSYVLRISNMYGIPVKLVNDEPSDD